MSTPVYLIQTPRAGALGYRFIVPPSLSNKDGFALARKYCSLATQSDEGRDYLAVVKNKIQDSKTGASRSGNEVLVIVGINRETLTVKDKSYLQKCLLNRMTDAETLITKNIDWKNATSSTAVSRPELEQWAREDRIQRYASKYHSKAVMTNEGKHKKGCVYQIILVSVLLLAAAFSSYYLLKGRNEESDSIDYAPTEINNISIWESCGLSSQQDFSSSLNLLLDNKKLSDGPFQKALSVYQPPDSVNPFIFMVYDLKKSRALSDILNIPSEGYSPIHNIR